jgi:ubiquinone/menaquinone biosynthesis C-methylase UbiE
VLDIGTGLGHFGLKKNNCNYVGLEANHEAVEILNKTGYVAVLGSGEKIPFKDNSFNTVTCFHVIEHSYYGEHIFNETYRVLQDNGLLIVAVPDYFTYNLHKEYGHVRFWSREDCIKFMTSIGFKVIRTTIGFQPDILRRKLAKEIIIIGKKG